MDKTRNVWITGASSGIGRALAFEFASHGDTVIASSRTRQALELLCNNLQSATGKCIVLECDVRQAGQLQRVHRELLAAGTEVDILVNNAGVTSFKDFISTTVEEFDDIVDTNLRGLFLATQTVLPGMVSRGAGTIINVLSYAGKSVYTGSSAYAASKAGAEALMNVVRAETREKGVKIVNVYPGAVLTGIWNPRHQERYGGRMMKPEEIARIIYDVSCQPASMMIEDLVIRPQGGDLKV